MKLIRGIQNSKKTQIALGKVGYLVLENMKNSKPELYAELNSKGILVDTIYEIQESVKEQIELIEKQLKNENPPPKTENTMELLKYNEWLKDMVWELVQYQKFFC